MRPNPTINPKPCAPGTRLRPDTALDSVSEAPGGVSPDSLIISRPSPPEAAVTGPSVFYRAEFWRVGVGLARHLPHGLLGRIAGHLARMYWAFNPARRRIVFENLLPVLNGDRLAARITTRELFQQFGFKLADLWRYESGLSIYNLFRDLTGWEHFQKAQAKARGVLLVTIHLGNWEFGAPLLTQRGIKLQVITGPEPQARLTQIRQAARSRWGIETLALSENPFSAVEIIRRLEQNNAVALLMDRPPALSAVTVNLFGRPFFASLSAAELARASGCALLPVYLPRTAAGYTAHILPEIPYDRRALGQRQGRVELTQQIMSAFEPALHLYLNQWYHFVPIWPR